MSDYLALVMFPALIGFIIAGFPIAFSMILVATLFGIMQFRVATVNIKPHINQLCNSNSSSSKEH